MMYEVFAEASHTLYQVGPKETPHSGGRNLHFEGSLLWFFFCLSFEGEALFFFFFFFFCAISFQPFNVFLRRGVEPTTFRAAASCWPNLDAGHVSHRVR
jgi:hypothetical protein